MEDSPGSTLRALSGLALFCGLAELLHWLKLGDMISSLADFYGPEILIVLAALTFALLQCGYAVYCFFKSPEELQAPVHRIRPGAAVANRLREEYAHSLQSRSTAGSAVSDAADYMQLRLEQALRAAAESDQSPQARTP